MHFTAFALEINIKWNKCKICGLWHNKEYKKPKYKKYANACDVTFMVFNIWCDNDEIAWKFDLRQIWLKFNNFQ